jgi:2-methylcitrate dehydratase PrpD
MGQQIETLAQFVAETKVEAIPAVVLAYSKLVVLDTVGVVLAGAERPENRELRERLAPTAGTGATVLARGFPQNDPRTAGLLNTIAGRSIELGAGHRYISYQGAMQIIPGVLAVGEWAKCSGREMLAAIILGYDLGARVALGMTSRPLAHQNGQAALLGAAAAGARVRGFNAADTSRTLRIATTLVLTPSYNNAIAGATTLNVAGGMSGFTCALAPDLALAGFTAQDDAVEEALGSLVGDGFKTERLLEQLGERWEITRDWLRLRACCNPIYAALDALDQALAAMHPRAEEIERIDVATFSFAAAMRNPEPPNYFASKYSLPHVAAVRVIKGGTGYADVDDTALQDPSIAAMRRRVHITDDPALSGMAPQQKPARVTLTLKDGRSSTHTVSSPRGDCLDPYDESEIRAKFRELAATALEPERIAAVENAIDCCEQWESGAELTALMRRHGRER